MFCGLVFEQLEPSNKFVSALLRSRGLARRDIAKCSNWLIKLRAIVPVHGVMEDSMLFVGRQIGCCRARSMFAMLRKSLFECLAFHKRSANKTVKQRFQHFLPAIGAGFGIDAQLNRF